jgi:hypothetical protein
MELFKGITSKITGKIVRNGEKSFPSFPMKKTSQIQTKKRQNLHQREVLQLSLDKWMAIRRDDLPTNFQWAFKRRRKWSLPPSLLCSHPCCICRLLLF